MRQNKKGWIMIIEAVMAVLILFGFVFLAMARQAQEAKEFQEKPSFYNMATILIDKARGNVDIRNYVLTRQEDKVTPILSDYLNMINPRYSITVDIPLNIGIPCTYPLESQDKEIYAADTVFAASPASDSKKLCIFVWEK